MEAKPPASKKELQRFLGQLNFLRRFISNLAGRVQVFSELLKLKSEHEFIWEARHYQVFEAIKGYLARPPVLRFCVTSIGDDAVVIGAFDLNPLARILWFFLVTGGDSWRKKRCRS